ncbi:MAG: hypothetical protein MMC23_002087 [Stictis urceolatum]|nr:hypothetical protein [Stictis urceolata]
MLTLTLTAELEGVTDLAPIDTEDNPYHYTFKVQCTSCREVHSNSVTLTRFEQNQVSGSRGEANFVWRCKMCKRESTANIISPPKAYEQASPPTRQKILEFDCRGLEFTEFKADGAWSAKGTESGTAFAEVTLEDGEWYDYDEKSGEEVSIKAVEWEIRRA